MSNQIKIFALGGQAEKGKSMYGVEINTNIYLVEAGHKFPEQDNIGIDVIIADTRYVVENKERVKAIFITHGHDDVMAALPYLLELVDVPVYAPTLAGDLIEVMVNNYNKQYRRKLKIDLHRVKRGSHMMLDKQRIQFFPLTHSFPGTVGVSFSTPQGAIVFAGEFIVDPGATDDFKADMIQMAEIGKKGVLCLMSESQGSERQGYTSPNHKITQKLEPIFENKSRIIVTVYSQNLFRIKEVVELVIKYNKRILFFSRHHDETQKIIQTGSHQRHPLIKVPPKNMASMKDLKNKQFQDLVVLMMAPANQLFDDLVDILDGGDDLLKINSTDYVVVASPVLPGAEAIASTAQDALYKMCDHVTILKSKEVWSTHASEEDLKMMLQLIKPKYYIPVKGDFRQLTINGRIAESIGYDPNHVIIMDNGEQVVFENEELLPKREIIPSGSLMIEGTGISDASSKVLDERIMLSEEGFVIIGITLNRQTKTVIAGPDVQMRGLVYLKDYPHIADHIQKLVLEMVSHYEDYQDSNDLKMSIREKVQKYIGKELKKKPVVLAMVLEVNEA